MKRAEAVRPRHSLALALLELARYLKKGYFVPLYVRYRLSAGLCRLAAQMIRGLFTSSYSLLVLPEGYTQDLTGLAVTEANKPLESVLPLKLR